MTTRVLIFVLAAATALTCPIAFAHPDASRANLEVILRDVGDGTGFGHVKFRQPKDADKIVYLGTWVRGLAPEHSYLLQRAVDTTLDGDCVSDAWLTLGEGLEPAAIATDARGTGRADLFRDLAAV